MHHSATTRLAALLGAMGLACGAGVGDGQVADSGPSGDGGPGSDGGAGGGATFAIVSNGAIPCEWILGEEVCPPDHNQELFRIDFDPTTGDARETRLTDNSDGMPPPDTGAAPDDDFFLALSPDGEWLYFANAMAGAPDIHRLRADGSSGPETLTSPGASDHFLALSSDGSTLWYVSNKDGKFDLFRMDAAGEDVLEENLTRAALADDLDEVHALLPDESGVILRVGTGFNDPDGTDVDGELYLFRFADRELVRLTDNRVNDKFAALSRDGGQVFFTRYDDANDDGVPDQGYNLWVAPADGSAGARRLTSYDSSSLELMAVTPDARRAIYEYRAPGAVKEIFSLVVSSRDATQISASPGGESSYFRLLSMDGASVIYTSNDRPGGFGDTEIYTVPVAGGESTLLTSFDNETYFLPFAHLASGLLLYDSPFDGDTDIFAVPMTGGEHVNLTRNEGWGDQVQGLSEDGALVFFSNLSDDPIYDEEGQLSPETDQDIYFVPTMGSGSIQQLTDNRVYDQLHAVMVAEPGGGPARQGRTAPDAGDARCTARAPIWPLANRAPSSVDDRAPSPSRCSR